MIFLETLQGTVIERIILRDIFLIPNLALEHGVHEETLVGSAQLEGNVHVGIGRVLHIYHIVHINLAVAVLVDILDIARCQRGIALAVLVGPTVNFFLTLEKT